MPDPTEPPFENRGNFDPDQHIDEDHDFFWGANPLVSTIKTFQRWLYLPDPTPVYAVLGTIAANRLAGGDPIWLGVIGPPSCAKTEILNSLSHLADVWPVATLSSVGALLSGTKASEKVKGAKGGLLREIGDFGILVLKDFSSILGMRTETRAEILAAFREIFDGAWTRHFGVDGGKTAMWTGKLGLVFACTQAYDTHHATIAALGDRFLLKRIEITEPEKLLPRAFEHTGEETQIMREQLATTVAALFIASAGKEPPPLTHAERDRLNEICLLATRLRATVIREPSGNREITDILDPEGTPRFGLALERLLAGLDLIGMERGQALDLIEDIAKDSSPRMRRKFYEYLTPEKLETAHFAKLFNLPPNSARRILEDLNAVGLANRERETKDVEDDQGDPTGETREIGPVLWSRNDGWKIRLQTNGLPS